MPDTPLNPDALDHLATVVFGCTLEEWNEHIEYEKRQLLAPYIRTISTYLAVAQPEVTSVEELVTTRVGLALANAAFKEGLSAGISACNASGPDRPFVKPVSPYSAPLLAMIKADRPEVDDA